MKIVRTQEEIDKKRIQIEDLIITSDDPKDKYIYAGARRLFMWLGGEITSVYYEE